MHPYEWGIIGVKALDFYPIFDCADCSHCSCFCGGFCGGAAEFARFEQLVSSPVVVGKLTKANNF